MSTIYVPRVFGGTLILTTGPYVAPRVLQILFVNGGGMYGIGPYGAGAYGSGQYYYAAPAQHINATFSTPVEHINAAFTEVAMITPFTTVDSSATVKDQNGSLISNLSVYTLSVSYQDGTIATPTVNNAGLGVYTATYNTKGPGTLTELWSFTDTSGDIAQDQRTLVIAY